MSGDAPVNSGAVEWPHPDSAYFTVRSMQIKLHRWAGEDSSRRSYSASVRGLLWHGVISAGYPVSAGSMPSGIQGFPLKRPRRASIFAIPHLEAVER